MQEKTRKKKKQERCYGHAVFNNHEKLFIKRFLTNEVGAIKNCFITEVTTRAEALSGRRVYVIFVHE